MRIMETIHTVLDRSIARDRGRAEDAVRHRLGAGDDFPEERQRLWDLCTSLLPA